MVSTRKVTVGILMTMIMLACNQNKVKEKESVQTFPIDSTEVVAVDSMIIPFNPDDEFLGIGIPLFGDLDSMIARRKIRVLVPYTYLYFYIEGKERRGIAFEAMNLFEEQINKKLGFYPPKIRVV